MVYVQEETLLKKTGLLTAASFIPFQSFFAAADWQRPIGIQLFSLPKMLSEDFTGTVKMLSRMGYTELELFGPYSFSSKSSQEGWRQAENMLGFSGSGFFGNSAPEIKTILSDHGLSSPSMHTDLDILTNHMDRLGEAANFIGAEYVVLPAILKKKGKRPMITKELQNPSTALGKPQKAMGSNLPTTITGMGSSLWME